MAVIRPAGAADAQAIAGIWNHYIRKTAVTFNAVEKSPAEVEAMVADRAARGFATFVAIAQGRVAGFVGYDQFRGGVGYARTGEHTILLDPAAAGRGLGRALMGALHDHAGARGIHSLFAGVSAENPAGIAFHAALGYAEVARLPEVGFKFGRWMDLHLMQKFL